jgi:hypothetical protein
MLRRQQIFFHIKHNKPRSVYIEINECRELHNILKPSEFELYMVLLHSILKNPTTDYYSTDSLCKELKVSKGTLHNVKSALKSKGLAEIIPFRDERNEPCLRVIVGRELMLLYSLGVNIAITNAKAYDKLVDKFPITNPDLTTEEREKLVTDCNQYYLDNPQEFK